MSNTIYHIAEDISLATGGVRTVLLDLNTFVPIPNIIITNKKEVKDNAIEFRTNKPWNYSQELSNYLSKLNKESIFHIHGVWQHTQYTALSTSKKNSIPHILTPHGMLNPWHLSQKRLKKKFYRKLVLENRVNPNSIIHAITPMERDYLQLIFPKSRIIDIPNLISTQAIPTVEKENKEPYFLFLGRLHPLKGMDILIEAFSELLPKNFNLKIYGSENSYSTKFKNQIKENGLSDRIQFLGHVSGEEKYKVFRNSWAFVSPSHSEVIGMVNLEGAIMETPVITTYQTGLATNWNIEGGKLINPNYTELKSALQESTQWSESERNARGKSLKAFVEKNYSWEKNKHLWENLYQELM